MVKKFHPDLNKSGSNEKIIELNEAYSALIKFLKNNLMSSLLKKDAESKIPDITISSKKVLILIGIFRFLVFLKMNMHLIAMKIIFLKKTLLKLF